MVRSHARGRDCGSGFNATPLSWLLKWMLPRAVPRSSDAAKDWNTSPSATTLFEGLASIVAGVIAGSVSLVGFGLDSVIEVASAAALLWRLQHDWNEARRERTERITLKLVGWCFVALAGYIVYESATSLLRHEAPERSIPGIIIAALSVIVMPLLSRAKRRVAAGIGSAAMRADSRRTDFCAYLSAILLGSLLLNALFGSWWADPLPGC